MKVRVDVAGAVEVAASMARLGKAARPAVKRAFVKFQKRVVEGAQAIAPVDDVDGGDLRASIRAAKVTENRNGVSAGVVAGGRRLEKLASEHGRKVPGVYGVVQHEDLGLKHAAGQGKFVEIPFFRELPPVPGDILDEIAKGGQ